MQNKRIVAVVVLLLVIAAGVALILLPNLQSGEQESAIHNEISVWREHLATATVPPKPAEPTAPMQTTNTEPTEPEERPYAALYEKMQTYNEYIYQDGQSGLVDAWSYAQSIVDLSAYDLPDEIFGIVSIPSIHVEMPLYLGASWDHMANGFAQMSQTSMPIGGENTNCVIAGHRGWYGMPYLRDVEDVKIGDTVLVQNPWEVLTYSVVERVVIEPTDFGAIHIQPGRDLVTLLTCHPYASGGTQRMLLICERVNQTLPAQPTEVEGTAVPETTQAYADRINVSSADTAYKSSRGLIFLTERLPIICLIILPFALAGIAVVVILRHGKEKKQGR